MENYINLINKQIDNPNEDTGIVIADAIISIGIISRSSDIHFEPWKNCYRVRYRVDGLFNDFLTIPNKLCEKIISRFKIMGKMHSYKTLVPQDGKFSFNHKNSETDIRASSLPTINGEKIVLRLFQQESEIPELNKFGFDENSLKEIEIALKNTSGTIFATGPSGSGKSTLLYSILLKLYELKGGSSNISTIEDPVERNFNLFPQIEINESVNFGFHEAVRALLRQDPEVIMIGEVRDPQTASALIRASLTGHLILTSLHCPSISALQTRLEDLGIDRKMLHASANTAINLRLIQGNCPHCIKSEKIKKEEALYLSSFYKDLPDSIYSSSGCIKCRNTGFLSRVPVYEICKKDQENKNNLFKKFISFKESVLYQLKSGKICFSTIAKFLTEEEAL